MTRWLRFWARGRCPSGLNSEEETFRLLQGEPASDEVLKEYAEDFGERAGFGAGERGFDSGYEILTTLTEERRQKIAKGYQEQYQWAESSRREAEQALFLLGEPVKVRLDPLPVSETRFERVLKP